MKESTIWRHPNKTVYILGAGFSKLAGIPTISEFIPQALQVLKEQDRESDVENFCRLINKHQIGANRLSLNIENLETLFCLIDLPSESEHADEDRKFLKQIIIDTICSSFKCSFKHSSDNNKQKPCSNNSKNEICNDNCCVPRRHFFTSGLNLKSIPRHKYGVCIYEAFLSYILECQKKINHKDDLNTIITFNYDLTIERAADNIKGPNIYYGEGIIGKEKNIEVPELFCLTIPKNISKTLYCIKIHGSLNWILDEETSERIYIKKSIEEILHSQNLDSEFVPLIPPTWKRGTEKKDIFSTMVSHAIHQLQLASKIIIIGYSIPDYDIYFKYMLAQALNTPEFPEIQIWDVKKDSKIKPRLVHIFGEENVKKNRVQYFKGGLRAFVTSHLYSPSDNKQKSIRRKKHGKIHKE